jgi:type I restriction enzyme S subunit
MSEWKKTRLGNLISIKGGFSYKGEFIGKGKALLLGMGCVSFSENFLHSGARLYSGHVPNTFVAKPNDIVLATRQQSDNMPILGVPAIIPESLKNETVIVGTNLYKVENESEVSNNFLFWLLKNIDYRNHIDSCAKGSTVKMITKDAVESYEFLCPPEKERNLISGTLWSINNKIDLLHRQNATLEKMAETLFRQWFVEEAKKNWDVFKMEQLISIGSGKGLKKESFIENGLYPILGANGEIGRTNEFLYNEKLIFTGRVGTLGNIFRIENEKVWLSDNTLIIKPLEYFNFIYFLLKNSRLRDYNAGSTQPLIRQSDVKEIDVVLPPKEVLKEFESFTEGIFRKIKSNRTQIRTLTELRDTLLPKLMSGEVRVEV